MFKFITTILLYITVYNLNIIFDVTVHTVMLRINARVFIGIYLIFSIFLRGVYLRESFKKGGIYYIFHKLIMFSNKTNHVKQLRVFIKHTIYINQTIDKRCAEILEKEVYNEKKVMKRKELFPVVCLKLYRTFPVYDK